MTIRVEQVSFSYGQKCALQSINLELRSGCFNALLGPNGAGKSTLFALLTRLYALQQGEIYIAGQSIRQHPTEVMRKLGVVFQQSTLDLDLTVAQNLYYHAALHGLSRKSAKPRIEQELDRLQLSDRLNDRVRNLNGGHRRRVEIARALLHQPSILLLDEASVGLDPATRQSLNQHVRQLCHEQGLTVLWSTHLIEEILDSDPVTILHQGKVEACDSASNLCRQFNYQSLTELFQQLTGDQPLPTPTGTQQ